VAREAAEPRRQPLDEAAPSDAPTPHEAAETRDLHDRLGQAVRALPLSLRQPALLTLEGFAPAEIADMLGLNPNAVSIRLTRAKAALRAKGADIIDLGIGNPDQPTPKHIVDKLVETARRLRESSTARRMHSASRTKSSPIAESVASLLNLPRWTSTSLASAACSRLEKPGISAFVST
jgi:DNA-binding CsgD family transcriptional regulator